MPEKPGHSYDGEVPPLGEVVAELAPDEPALVELHEGTEEFSGLLTDRIVNELEAYIRNGAHPNDAAGACGINRKTRHRYMQRGEKPDAHPLLRRFRAVMLNTGAVPRTALGMVLYAKARKGDLNAISLWHRYVGTVNFLPQARMAEAGDDPGIVEIVFDGANVLQPPESDVKRLPPGTPDGTED